MTDRLGGSRERLGVEELVKRSVSREGGDKMIAQEYRCWRCGKPLTLDKVWRSDNRCNRKPYCYDCAAPTAVRLKDLMGPLKGGIR